MAIVFLTGASGFLGGHLLDELLAAGHQVRALSRRPETDADIEARGATPVRAQLHDVGSLKAAMDGAEAVFHAAADTSTWKPKAEQQTATNVVGTQNLLDAAKQCGIKAFMHTSSVSAYSHDAICPLTESTVQMGGSSWINYDRSKFLGEAAVRRSDLDWMVFNPSHILGPGDRHNWARLIMLVDRQELPGIPPGVGSFADVREIARAQIRAWQHNLFRETFLLGGEHASFVELVGMIAQRLERKAPRLVLPYWLAMSYAHVLDAWSRLSGKEPDLTPESVGEASWKLSVDSSKAERMLAYRQTPLPQLLDDMLIWMGEQQLLIKS